MRYSLVFLVLLVSSFSLAFAATYSTSATFEDEDGGTTVEEFSTSMSFTSDYSCSIVSGKALGSGDPCKGGAQVCVDSTVRLTPSVRGRWATGGNLNIDSLYPFCRDPSDMEGYTSKTERDVRWIDSSYYDAHMSDWQNEIHDGSAGEALYTAVGGSFPSQSVDYYREVSAPPYTNKRGYADVLCKGRMEFRTGTTGDSDDITTAAPYYDITLSGVQNRSVSISLKNVDCFAGVVKHPIDSGTDCFRLYTFAYNDPSIPTITESSTIRVVDVQPGLDVTSVVAEQSSPPTYLFHITVRNTGDVRERVTGVRALPSSSNAHAAGGLDCLLYGWFCTGDNGFGQYFNPGDDHDLYVTYTGPLSGEILNLSYDSSDPTCSGSTSWNATVDIPTDSGITRCAIEPLGLSLTPLEIHEWTVTCYNAIGAEVPCAGDDWSFEGITGGFVSRSSTNALGYVTDVSKLPTWIYPDYIVYETDGVRCVARVISYAPERPEDPDSFVCDLTPDSADLDVGDSQDFELNCTLEGVPTDPSSADYSNENGLDGSLTGGSTDGVTFTATTSSEGDVQVIAWYGDPADPTLRGAIDWSHIIVGNLTNETTPGNETEPGGEVKCIILPGDISPAFPSMSGAVLIKCGPAGNETCPGGVTWASSIAAVSGDNTGALYTINSDAAPGTGTITAQVETDSEHTGPEGVCEALVRVQEPECIILS